MPKHLESLRQVCEILLLLEALKQQRPGLRPAPLRSLIESVERRRPKARRGSVSPLQALRDQIKVPAAMNDLEIISGGLAIAPGEIALPEDDEDTDFTTITRRFQVEGLRFVEFPLPPRVPIVPVAVPRLAPPLGPLEDGKTIRRIVNQTLQNERVREAACGIAAPFLIRFIGSPNVPLRLAAMVAAAGCGFELVE